MPNIILSEGSEKLNALYGKIQAPIASYLQKRGEAFEQASIAKEIFVKHPSTHWAEGYGGLTGMDDFEPTPENGAYPTNGFEEGYFQTIQNYTWKSSFAISREMVDDGKLVDFKKKPERFIQAAYRTQERFFAQMLGEALQGKTDFTIKGQAFSAKSADGLCMFSNAHKAKVSGDTIVNAYKDAFSKDALGKATTARPWDWFQIRSLSRTSPISKMRCSGRLLPTWSRALRTSTTTCSATGACWSGRTSTTSLEAWRHPGSLWIVLTIRVQMLPSGRNESRWKFVRSWRTTMQTSGRATCALAAALWISVV